MKRPVVVLGVALFLSAVIVGCKKGIDKVLVGTWNVTNVEVNVIENGLTVFSESDTVPVGTVTFRNNGKGEQNYSFQYNGAQSQTGSFSWSATDDLIIINRNDDSDMEWRRIVNTSNKQIASFNILKNADQSVDYTLTLEK